MKVIAAAIDLVVLVYGSRTVYADRETPDRSVRPATFEG